MTTTPFRRARGTRTDVIPLYVEVDKDASKVLDDFIQATGGAPKWAVMEHLLKTAPRTSDGLPVGWPQAPNAQEELPILRAG